MDFIFEMLGNYIYGVGLKILALSEEPNGLYGRNNAL